MTDRELLELAARAAGIGWDSVEDCWYGDRVGPSWNPLTDDGDALRLAVKLQLTITQMYVWFDAERQFPTTVKRSGGGMRDDIIVSYPSYRDSFTEKDPYAATRRAIVRAAAEIGRTMQ